MLAQLEPHRFRYFEKSEFGKAFILSSRTIRTTARVLAVGLLTPWTRRHVSENVGIGNTSAKNGGSSEALCPSIPPRKVDVLHPVLITTQTHQVGRDGSQFPLTATRSHVQNHQTSFHGREPKSNQGLFPLFCCYSDKTKPNTLHRTKAITSTHQPQLCLVASRNDTMNGL